MKKFKELLKVANDCSGYFAKYIFQFELKNE